MVSFIFKRKLKIVLVVALFSVMFVPIMLDFINTREMQTFKEQYNSQIYETHEVFNPFEIKQISGKIIDLLYKKATAPVQVDDKTVSKIDWNDYAYISFVTDYSYICNSVILFKRLHKLGAKAKMILLISSSLLDDQDINGKLTSAVAEMTSTLPENTVTLQLLEEGLNDDLSKLTVFRDSNFKRLIYLDNDSIIYSNLDELFFLPEYIQFAAPLAYYELGEDEYISGIENLQEENFETNLDIVTDFVSSRISEGSEYYNFLPTLPTNLYINSNAVANNILKSTETALRYFDFSNAGLTSKLRFTTSLMVLTPSSDIFQNLKNKILPSLSAFRSTTESDVINEEMFNLRDIISRQFSVFKDDPTIFKPEVIVLPYDRYGMISMSLKEESHYPMLDQDIIGYQSSNPDAEFDLVKIISEMKFLHLKEEGIEKPWRYDSISDVICVVDGEERPDSDLGCGTWKNQYKNYFQFKELCPTIHQEFAEKKQQ